MSAAGLFLSENHFIFSRKIFPDNKLKSLSFNFWDINRQQHTTEEETSHVTHTSIVGVRER
jgi:hypothetical protein